MSLFVNNIVGVTTDKKNGKPLYTFVDFPNEDGAPLTFYFNNTRDAEKPKDPHVLLCNDMASSITAKYIFKTAPTFLNEAPVFRSGATFTNAPASFSTIELAGSVNNNFSIEADNSDILTVRFCKSDGKNIVKSDPLFQLSTKGEVTALSYNATSDRRAKENIQLADFCALNIVENLPIYTFDYKDTDVPSIGVMAQDVQTITNPVIPNFSFVSNPLAKGVDGDYMSVKETKLIYVLWKAVQELSAKVDTLEAELNKKA